ncbi:MAG: phage terminase large subunit [Planctomycetes bacterium]|nr:phage terminase large subunit [Planctomycetota bacterium]
MNNSHDHSYRAAARRLLSQARRDAAEHCLRVFAETYLPAYFQLPASRMHLELFELLEGTVRKRGQRIAIAAPREHAKSTLVTLGYCLWCICYAKEPCIFLISDTAEQAMELLAHIKHELEANALLLEDFPEACEVPGAKPRAPRWRKADIITRNDVKVAAFGADQKIRGRRHRQHRPTLIVVDDVENESQVRSADQRAYLRDWFDKAVLKAGSAVTNVVVVGTILHFGSLLAELTDRQKSPAWIRRKYKAILSWSDQPELWYRWERIYNDLEEFDGRSGQDAALAFFNDQRQQLLEGTDVLWPERDSYYRLMETRLREGRRSFDSEKQNEPVDPADCMFQESDLVFWDDEFPSVDELNAAIDRGGSFYGACDPSMGNKGPRGDYSAIITLFVPRGSPIRYVVAADIRRRKPDEIIDAIIEHHKLYRYRLFGMESVQYQAFLASELRKRALARGMPLRVTELTPHSNKQGRIEALQPAVRGGRIRFSRRQTDLLDQLRQFPLGAYDDGPDALQMAYMVSHRGGKRQLRSIPLVTTLNMRSRREHWRPWNGSFLNP